MQKPQGRLSLTARDEPRPRWHRFFGADRYWWRIYFIAEWSGSSCGLFFLDEDASEFRTLAPPGAACVDEEDRKEIRFGELERLAVKYCLPMKVAVRSIEEFFVTGARPEWLEYEFVP